MYGNGQYRLSFCTETKNRILSPQVRSGDTDLQTGKRKAIDNSPKFSEHAKKARLYVSHFIQVLNFCIARGEMKPAIRSYYGLEEKSSKVPPLLTEQDLLFWGEKSSRANKTA